MIVLYRDKPILIYCFNHQLGSVERDLSQLQAEKLLLGSVEALSAIGYSHNFGVGRNESLLSLAMNPVSLELQNLPEPNGFVFLHCYAESAVLHYDVNETDMALLNHYFQRGLMRNLKLDHLLYFCS